MDKCLDHGQKGNRKGYGSLSLNGKTGCAHRVAYCKHHGVDMNSLAGLVVRHSCDNPRCINPSHLVLGSEIDNVQDRQVRGRQAKGEKVGISKLNAELVKKIRAEYVKGSNEFGTYGLARKFGISQRAVWEVVNSITWSHI